MPLYPYSLPPLEGLSFSQLDGWDCIYCGYDDWPMRPVGYLRDAQVFAHKECASEHRIND